MNIAYVTTLDPKDVNSWSGTVFFMRKCLEEQGARVDCIGPLHDRYGFWLKRKLILYGILRRRGWLKKRHLRDREPALLRAYARQVRKRLEPMDADMVLSPQTVPICRLDCRQPIVFWTDATFAGIKDYYEGVSNLNRESIRNGNRMEQEALSRCRLAIYSSEWARETAIQSYDVAPEKVHVVPFGANLLQNRLLETVKPDVDARPMNRCRLLFSGADWQRKGGDIALRVVKALNESGFPAELELVGFKPPGELPGYIRRHGYVSKQTPEGLEKNNRLFADAHFLILPSRAECCANVFAEASAFGVPSLASDTGGISAAVRNGVNGQMFPVDADPAEYCAFIKKVMTTPGQYRALALSSFQEYRDRLNWTVAGREVMRLIREHCGK